MRFMFRTLAVATAAIVLSGSAFAAQVAPAAKATPAAPVAKSAAAKPTKAAKVTVISTAGTVSKFDAATNALTVTTPKGDVMFTVDASASILANGKRVMASDLPNHVGHKVTVRYTESGTQKTAESIRVTMPAAKTASMKKAAPAKKS
jgi:hypothetical protein